MIKFIFLAASLFAVVLNRIIWEEKISTEEYKKRIENFNNWYKEFNPSSKVEARLGENDKIGVFATEELNVNL